MIKTTQKRHNFACDNYIFPKTRATRTSSEPITVPLKTLSFFPQNLSMLNRTDSHNPLTRFHICTHKFSMAVICLFGSYGI